MSATSQQTTQSNNSSSGTTSGTSNSTTSPWQLQSPYLAQAFSGASGALPVAQQYTPEQLAAFMQMQTYGTNVSGPNAVPVSSANAGSALSTTGATGAATGVNNLTNFNPALTNNTANNIANANQYVAGQNIPAQVAADMQSANQEANYVTNPGIDASAAATGNINSSRDAIEHGLVATNLAQTAANTGAQLQANDYNTGLSLSEQQDEANNSAALNAALGLTTGSGYVANAGTAANTGSVGQAGGLYGIANTGITGENTDPFSALQNFYNIIGANNWGNTTSGSTTGTSQSTGSGSSTSTATPSQLSQIGGWVNLAGSLI
jgi:hypothetical protein